MAKFVLRRALAFIPVLLVIVTITFFLVRAAPGGPFDAERAVSPQVLRQLEAQYHLDAPLHQQYFNYIGNLFQGDLGPSFRKPSHSVREWIAMRVPVSLELGAYAILVALTIGLATGIFAALKPNSYRDYVPMSVAMVGICVPNFVLGPLLVLVLAMWMGLLPVSGWETAAHRILPSLTLGAAFAAYIARLSRGGMLEVLGQDFIRTARAKGLSEAAVILRHGLRGGLQPVVSFMGPAMAALLAGSFVVERIFQVPGLGREFIEAAFNRDYTLLTGIVLFYAMLIIVFNLVVDVVLAWMDPRLRYD